MLLPERTTSQFSVANRYASCQDLTPGISDGGAAAKLGAGAWLRADCASPYSAATWSRMYWYGCGSFRTVQEGGATESFHAPQHRALAAPHRHDVAIGIERDVIALVLLRHVIALVLGEVPAAA